MPHRSKKSPRPSWSPRTRPLFKLKDQEPGRTISPDLFDVPGRDRTWNPWAENFLRVNQPQFEELAIEGILTPRPDTIALVLRPGGTIGAIPLQSPDTHKIAGGIIVEPRFGWNDMGSLLTAIGWSASPQLLKYSLVPGSAREIPPWVIAGPIIQRIAALLKALVRGFRIYREVRTSPRGHILWPTYAQEQMTRGQWHHLPCEFPELGPDLLLRGYLRWSLERVRSSLKNIASTDAIARYLIATAEKMLWDVHDVPPRIPDHRTLDQLALGTGLPSALLREGLEAVGWVLDERGLAGTSDLDGLSWRLPMSELFERWVETIAREWAHQFGGTVTTARTGDARFPLLWSSPGASSLRDLAPDIVIQAGDTTFILDAKYKGHFEELDDTRWREMADDLRAEHRHDMHQVLAYASLFDTPRVVASLLYPVFPGTWDSHTAQGRIVTRARLGIGSRQLEVALVGIPLQIAPGRYAHNIAEQLNVLQTPLGE